jgi:hypothetical protein
METLQPTQRAILDGGRQLAEAITKTPDGQLVEAAQAPDRELTWFAWFLLRC